MVVPGGLCRVGRVVASETVGVSETGGVSETVVVSEGWWGEGRGQVVPLAAVESLVADPEVFGSRLLPCCEVPSGA